MAHTAELVEAREDGRRRLALSGRVTIAHIAPIAPAFAAIRPDGEPLVVDLGHVERIDTAGAWLVHKLLRDWKAAGQAAEITNASPEAVRLIDEVAANDRPSEIHAPRGNRLLRRLEKIGAAIVYAVHTLGSFLSFLGATLIVLFQTVIGRRPLRVNAVVHQMEATGINALGIVGLLSFLIGLVLAQQGSVQLERFGATIFVVDLVSRGTIRELGVLLAAIMVAGRSSSAFAAQLGSMKLAQEIDAMSTIGMSSTEVLVIPRLIAMAVMMLLLAFFGSICSIVGGALFAWVALGITPAAFAARMQEVVPITDVWIGLIKAPVFGVIIAVTGCFQGMQVEGNAESVGKRTTEAVVQAIFIVIVADAFFAVFFTAIGFG